MAMAKRISALNLLSVSRLPLSGCRHNAIQVVDCCWKRRGFKGGLDQVCWREVGRKSGTLEGNHRRRLSVLEGHLAKGEFEAMADEKAAALKAAAVKAKDAAEAGEPTLFDKIISKQIPSTVVYEDESVMAFRDISPQGPVHIILIPKDRDGLTQLSKAEERHTEVLGHLLVTAAKVARQEGLKEGFRLVINDGVQGCQSVYHLHLHLIGGRQMNWPPG